MAARARRRCSSLADQPAANPRPRRGDVAPARRRDDGPARRCCSTGASATSAPASVAGHVEQLLLPLLRRLASRRRWSAIASAGPWRSRPPTCVRANASSRSPRRGIFRIIRTRRGRHWRHVAHREPAAQGARRAADGSAPGGLLVARSPAHGRASSPNSAGSPASAEARRFVELEDWANEGEPLPYPAARELIEDCSAATRPGGAVEVGGRAISELDVPASTSPPARPHRPGGHGARRRSVGLPLGPCRNGRRLGARQLHARSPLPRAALPLMPAVR